MAGGGRAGGHFSFSSLSPSSLEVFPRQRLLPSGSGDRSLPPSRVTTACSEHSRFNLLPLIAKEKKKKNKHKIGLFGHLMKIPASSHFPAVL